MDSPQKTGKRENKIALEQYFLSPISSDEICISDSQVVEIPVDEICLNPMQPRKRIPEETIEELAESIREHGIIQPIVVTKIEGLFHLVVGERRLRAAKKLGMEKIPAVIRESSWEEMLLVTLVENIQREELNCIEEARAFKLLISEFGMTQEEIAVSVGKSRPYIANTVRLLNLPDPIISDLESGELSSGHARALLSLSDTKLILELAKKIKKQNLSVRQTEELVNRLKETNIKEEPKPKTFQREFREIQERLSEKLSTRVNIKTGKNNAGKIEIHYSSLDEFNRLVEILGIQENLQ